MFNQITELKSIRTQKYSLQKREAELLKPVLIQLDMLPTLFNWFIEIQENIARKPDKSNVWARKQFIFIILTLYSPGSLAGKRMKPGLRDKLAEIFRINSRTIISDNCAAVVFYYQQYKDFRIEVDYTYVQMLNRLSKENIEL